MAAFTLPGVLLRLSGVHLLPRSACSHSAARSWRRRSCSPGRGGGRGRRPSGHRGGRRGARGGAARVRDRDLLRLHGPRRVRHGEPHRKHPAAPGVRRRDAGDRLAGARSSRRSEARGRGATSRQRRLDLAIIATASLYAPLIVLRGHLAWTDAIVLIGLYVLYLRRASTGSPEPPHLVGVSAELGKLPKKRAPALGARDHGVLRGHGADHRRAIRHSVLGAGRRWGSAHTCWSSGWCRWPRRARARDRVRARCPQPPRPGRGGAALLRGEPVDASRSARCPWHMRPAPARGRCRCSGGSRSSSC